MKGIKRVEADLQFLDELSRKAIAAFLEKEREKMHIITRKYGLRSPQALRQSQLLDAIVFYIMKNSRIIGIETLNDL